MVFKRAWCLIKRGREISSTRAPRRAPGVEWGVGGHLPYPWACAWGRGGRWKRTGPRTGRASSWILVENVSKPLVYSFQVSMHCKRPCKFMTTTRRKKGGIACYSSWCAESGQTCSISCLSPLAPGWDTPRKVKNQTSFLCKNLDVWVSGVRVDKNVQN